MTRCRKIIARSRFSFSVRILRRTVLDRARQGVSCRIALPPSPPCALTLLTEYVWSALAGIGEKMLSGGGTPADEVSLGVGGVVDKSVARRFGARRAGASGGGGFGTAKIVGTALCTNLEHTSNKFHHASLTCLLDVRLSSEKNCLYINSRNFELHALPINQRT